jgi:hypothetical protein
VGQEVVLQGAFDVSGDHIALVLGGSKVHGFQNMGKGSIVNDGLLQGIDLISGHAETGGIILRLVIISSVAFKIPEDNALNIGLFLVEQKGQHGFVIVSAFDGSAGRERVRKDFHDFKLILVAEFTDSGFLFIGGGILHSLLITFGISAVDYDFVSGFEWTGGYVHVIIPYVRTARSSPAVQKTVIALSLTVFYLKSSAGRIIFRFRKTGGKCFLLCAEISFAF